MRYFGLLSFWSFYSQFVFLKLFAEALVHLPVAAATGVQQKITELLKESLRYLDPIHEDIERASESLLAGTHHLQKMDPNMRQYPICSCCLFCWRFPFDHHVDKCNNVCFLPCVSATRGIQLQQQLLPPRQLLLALFMQMLHRNKLMYMKKRKRRFRKSGSGPRFDPLLLTLVTQWQFRNHAECSLPSQSCPSLICAFVLCATM
jgi:hypothetical protein